MELKSIMKRNWIKHKTFTYIMCTGKKEAETNIFVCFLSGNKDQLCSIGKQEQHQDVVRVSYTRGKTGKAVKQFLSYFLIKI